VNGPPPLDIGCAFAKPIWIVMKQAKRAVALAAKKRPQFFCDGAMIHAEPLLGSLLANGADAVLLCKLVLICFRD
jgi:hypothetical protein